jgi:8-oxo-dGTP diphosphatase
MKLATLCYIRKNGRTLMMHRIKRKDDMHYGKWNGLGGKMHPGETPEECIIREVREESGFEIRDPHLNGFLTFPSFDESDDWYVFVFTVNRFKGKLLTSSEGELQWVDDKDLLKLDLWEGDQIFLPWLAQKKFFSAKFNYRDGKLKDYLVNFY